MSSSHDGLALTDLETVYDDLARALDEAGPQRSEIFLVKLALLNANALNDPEQFRRHLQTALKDLADG